MKWVKPTHHLIFAGRPQLNGLLYLHIIPQELLQRQSRRTRSESLEGLSCRHRSVSGRELRSLTEFSAPQHRKLKYMLIIEEEVCERTAWAF